MDITDPLENEILLRNALRLGVSARARDPLALAEAIRDRLGELGFHNVAGCEHCRRRIPDFSICPYCSAPRGLPSAIMTQSVGAHFQAHFSWPLLLQSISRPYFLAIVFLATAPMILKFFGMGEKWMFVYFSLFWGYVFFKVTHVPARLWRVAAFGYVFTGLISLPLLVAWISVPPHMTESLVASPELASRMVGFIVGVGVREELTKIIAVVWMARLRIGGKRILSNPTEALVVGSMCGLGFAAVENMDYLERFQFLDKLHYTFGLYQDNLSFRGSISRVMLTPFVHAVWSGILAYFTVAALSSVGANRRNLFLVGLMLASFLHGIYDVFSTIPRGDLFVFLVVALSFAVWLACYERGRSFALNKELTV